MITTKIINNSAIIGINNIIKALGKQSRQVILKDMAVSFQEMTFANFGSAGPYRDSTWAPLSKEYAKKKGSNVATDKDTGALKNSIKIGPIKENYTTVYSNSPYAASVAYGGGKTPGRNFWPVQMQGKNKNYSRLQVNAEKVMNSVISKKLSLLSSGQLPFVLSGQRAGFDYGNPLTGPGNIKS